MGEFIKEAASKIKSTIASSRKKETARKQNTIKLAPSRDNQKNFIEKRK